MFVMHFTYTIGYYRAIDLVSHTTYIVCVNLIHGSRDVQFTLDSS